MSMKPWIFNLGRVYATPGALNMLAQLGRHPDEFIVRHLAGDDGDLCLQDKQSNREALLSGGRLLSSYSVGRGPHEADWRLWIISDPPDDQGRRSVVCILPEEY